MDVAARERNVFAALVVNSIAEHFLQDFFAPGHIVTPRFGLHDAAALAFHNHYNSRGSTFVIDETLYERDLLPLLQYVCAADLDIRVLATAPGLGKTPVPLWGDSNLKQSPEQELLMTLVSARSVLDILESAASGNAVNSFQDVQWVPTARLPGSRRLLLAGGRLPYGRYEHLQKDVRFLYGGTILGLSGGAQVLRSSAVTTMRTAYQLDWIVTGNPPILAPRGQFSGRSYSIRIGYVYEHNEDEIARGPAARAVWAIPLIHSQVSGDVAYKTYLRGSDGARKLAYGVRYQTGFSVLNLDLGVGRDYTFTTGGLEPALATRFGFTVAGPVSSIPVLGEIEKSIFRWRRRSLEGATSRSPEQRTSSGVR